MAIVACIWLLLSYSLAGQAKSASSLGSSPVAHSSGMHGIAKPEDLLVKRTSGSHLHRPRLPSVQGTGLQPLPPTYIPLGAPRASHALGGDHSGPSAPGMVIPSQVSGEGPSTDPSVAKSVGKRPYKANKRPPGLLTDETIAKAMAIRETKAGSSAKNKRGKRTDLTILGRLKYATASKEEIRALRNGSKKRWLSKLTPEERLEARRRQNESNKRWKEKQKARLKKNNMPGLPLQKAGKDALEFEQEQAGADEPHRHVSADTRMEEATESAVDGQHAPAGTHEPPATLKLRTSAMSVGTSSLHAPLPGAPHQFFPPGPSLSFSLPNLRLSLSAPGSSKSGQKHSLRQAAPPAAGVREEERLQLTLAPPSDHDGLRLALAPPRHD